MKYVAFMDGPFEVVESGFVAENILKPLKKDYSRFDCLVLVDMITRGKTYAERKENVRQQAMDYQSIPGWGIDLSYSELVEFQTYFEKQAARYGLKDEFLENGIL